MSEFLCFTSQLYLSESDTLESYIDEVLINPNKDELSQIIAFLTLIILAIILVKLYLNGNNNFWPDRGVMLVRTSDTSSILDILRGHTSYTRDFDISIYKKLQDKKFAGLMEVQRPVFFVKDIDLAKRILCEDYDHFVTQQKFMLEKTNPLIMEMFIMLTRMKWGEMRTTPVHPPTMLEAPAPTTQTSTTTRLVEEHLRSQLFSHFNSSGAQLVEFVRRESEKVENHTDGISVTECFGRFTMDVIAKACFGVENSCLNEKESGLYKYREMFQLLGPWRMAKVFISFLFPRVAALFRISFIEQESTKFFKNIVEHTINHRKNNEKAYNTASAAAAGKKNGSLRLRQDFLQLLLDTRDKQMKIDEASELEHSLMTRPTPTLPPSSPPLKIAESENYSDYPKSTRDSTANAPTRSTGALLTDDNDGRSNAGNKLYLTDELILAQSICSFLAEYDTMASHLLSLATYALAVNPECQEKLYTEIVQCLRREKSGALDYNSVNSIEYMDMFINETLRMFPSSSRVEIRCTKEYQVDRDHDAAADTNLRLPRETLVVIPIIAFHYDELYFPDPDKFIAERWFSPESRSKIHPFPFIPFGYGPQSSGKMFAVAGVKTTLAHLVHNFIIEPTASTPIPMEYDNFSPLLKPVRMMKIRFRPRK